MLPFLVGDAINHHAAILILIIEHTAYRFVQQLLNRPRPFENY
jgi:hypothetical protein